MQENWILINTKIIAYIYINIVAVILLHGKADNNIGYSRPIGTYDIGLDSACSIFEYLLEKLKKLT